MRDTECTLKVTSVHCAGVKYELGGTATLTELCFMEYTALKALLDRALLQDDGTLCDEETAELIREKFTRTFWAVLS